MEAKSMKLTMSVLVKNHAGILYKVVGLFSRRAYNIHSLAVGTTSDSAVSRMTIVVDGDSWERLPNFGVKSLPIVGGSILSHDHYQGGRYTFAMERAPIEKEYSFPAFPEVRAGRVKWPMSVLRLHSANKEQLIGLADHILAVWRGYSDASVGVLAGTDGVPHNTITPIARRRDGAYEFDLVLRNNRTTPEHPLGLFHPHAEVHHIKKENIGLIEVLGLAILPARLKQEIAAVRVELLQGPEDISDVPGIAAHAEWYRMLREKYRNITEAQAEEILKKEIGLVFLQVLLHAGVFKRDEQGLAAFDAFAAASAK